MADSYLTISVIAADPYMNKRVTSAVTQQIELGWTFLPPASPGGYPDNDAVRWVQNNAYRWASSPTWAEKWDYAVATNIEEPGKDPAVISDGDILATVQHLGTAPA